MKQHVTFRVESSKLEYLKNIYDTDSISKILNRLVDEKIETGFSSEANFPPFVGFGGKSRVANKLIALMPKHKTYIELFGNSASVLLRKPPSDVEIYNDIDNQYTNFYRVLQSDPVALFNKCNAIPYSQAFFRELKKLPLPEDNVERAARFFFLSRASVYGQSSGFKLPIDSKSNYAKVYSNRTSDFKAVSKRFRYVNVANNDFKKLIIRQQKDINAFFFCDPPYLGTDHYYSESFSLNNHNELLYCLCRIKGKFMVTHDSHPVINKLYKDFYHVDIRYSFCATKSIIENDTLRKPKRILRVFMNYIPTCLK